MLVGKMFGNKNNLILFEGKTPFNKLKPLLDLRAKLDLRSTKLLSGKKNWWFGEGGGFVILQFYIRWDLWRRL